MNENHHLSTMWMTLHSGAEEMLTLAKTTTNVKVDQIEITNTAADDITKKQLLQC